MAWCNTYALTVPDAHTKDLLDRGLIPAGVQIGARIIQPLKIRAVAPAGSPLPNRTERAF